MPIPTRRVARNPRTIPMVALLDNPERGDNGVGTTICLTP